MKRWWTMVAIFAWLAPGAARAQTDVPGKIGLSLVGGLSAASGQSANNWSASYSAGGEADFAVAPQWGLIGSIAYNEAKPLGTTNPDKATVIELGLNVKYVITAATNVQPYLRFGGGLYKRDLGSGQTGTNGGLSGGAGVDFNLPDSPLGFSLIARFHRVFITSTSVQTGDWEYFNIWGGVRFRIG